LPRPLGKEKEKTFHTFRLSEHSALITNNSYHSSFESPRYDVTDLTTSRRSWRLWRK